MSLAITHFALGMALTTIFVQTVASDTRFRMSLGVLGGLWALIPDLHYLLSGRPAILFGLKHTIIGNAFWFHATLDTFDQGRGSRRVAAVALGFLLVTIVVTEGWNCLVTGWTDDDLVDSTDRKSDFER